MELFSQRKGLKPVKNVIQKDSMDDDLRNGLWNILYLYCWTRVLDHRWFKFSSGKFLIQSLWLDYFKRPLDEIIDDRSSSIVTYIKHNDYSNFEWYEVYDFIEFVANCGAFPSDRQSFTYECNKLFEKELSGYRFVGGKITDITSEEEIAAIESALAGTDSLKPVREHLGAALELYADRDSPNYRNSIKESISAVESLCKMITGDSSATLGQALKQLEGRVDIHGALRSAFSSLYGYTSDAQGIRHGLGLTEDANLQSEDAKFMLVSCSAFINYLMEKTARAGIELSM